MARNGNTVVFSAIFRNAFPLVIKLKTELKGNNVSEH